MPEGPEVRVIATALYGRYGGQTMTDIGWDDKSKFRFKSEVIESVRLLLPARLDIVTCRGKKLLFVYSSMENGNEEGNEDGTKFGMLSGLGMEGRWSWKRGSHSNLWLVFTTVGSDGVSTVDILYYDDSRHFGNIDWFVSLDQAVTTLYNSVGPDLLAYAIDCYQPEAESKLTPDGEEITTEVWLNAINKARSSRAKDKQICEFLMDQKQFSGIGNYLKAEILFESKIKPDRTLISLSDDEIETIRLQALRVIYEALLYGGLTIATFWSPDGHRGRYPVKVYKKAVDPDKNPVITSTFRDKRTTHWVPAVQL